MTNLHDNHIKILSNFIFKEEAHKDDLDFGDIHKHQEELHLEQLVEHGYLLKNTEGNYVLTTKGKDVAGRLDFETGKVEQVPKTVLEAVCRRVVGGKEEYLMHVRREHPYYGFLGFPTGTAKHGSYLEEGVIRELEEETGMTGRPVLKEIKHMLIKTRDTGEVMDDVVMYAFDIKGLSGTLLESTPEGENMWMTVEQIYSYPQVSQNVMGTLESFKHEGVVFIEEVQEYDSL